MKNALLVLALLSTGAMAQIQVNSMAEAGRKEVFVFLGKGIVSATSPYQNITAYKVERKAGNQWMPIAEVQAPKTFGEFKQRFESALAYFPQPHYESPVPLDLIWQTASRYNVSDSIAPYNFYLPVMLGMGYATVDASVKPKVSYQYRVSHQINGNWQVAFVTNTVSLPFTNKMPRPQPYRQFTQANQIELTFLFKGKGLPSYYQVLRRDGFSGEFAGRPLPKVLSAHGDSLFVMVRDTLVEAHQAYEYIMASYDRVGNANLNSDTVTVASYNFNEATLPYSIHAYNKENVPGILLGWRLDKPGLSRGLRLFRSEFQSNGFESIADLPPTDTLYIDQQVEPMKRYYYQLRVLGVLGESSPSSATVFGVFQDRAAPLPPTGLSAVPEQQGVRLQWRPGDTHIKGYYVYRGMEGEKLGQVSPFITDTTYLDTSQTLSGRIFYNYAVRSENLSLIASPFSDTVQVRPEVPTQPLKPRELLAAGIGPGIRLSWLDMKALDNSIESYEIERKARQVPDTLFRVEENSFYDTTALHGVPYAYRVRAIDMFGGASDWGQEATALLAGPSTSLFSPPGFQAFKGDGAITLRWGGSLQQGLASYKIYRKTLETPAILLATVEANTYEYIDQSVKKGEKYFYYITAVGGNGESERGAAIVISY
ncbi:MAG: hypothetical protein M9954_15915 [Cyclobacteriaceae bacterium]|nr:hypothetical protein [Cyclobacteriaceae bacterium]